MLRNRALHRDIYTNSEICFLPVFILFLFTHSLIQYIQYSLILFLNLKRSTLSHYPNQPATTQVQINKSHKTQLLKPVMQFFVVLGAALAAFMAGPANAEPVSRDTVAPRQYQNYCCTPGCLWCSIRDCLNEGCSGVFGSCCSEGFRNVTADGEVQVFNTEGRRIRFFEEFFEHP
ncbi:hypothetical protein GGR54DRAFT_614019 [Hypoxylon sp. NC1633]|nr:hypothetical protein GGR54DRAFT_614019 [Hypoxylon sp. NC1633]